MKKYLPFLIISLLFTTLYHINAWGEENGHSPGRVVRDAVVDFIYENASWEKEMVEVGEIKIRTPLSNLKGELKVVLPRGAKLIGKTTLLVKVINEGIVIKEIWVVADVRVFTEVVVAGRALKRGHVIQERDILVIQKDLSKLPLGAISRPEQAIGMKLKRTVSPKTVLKDGILDYPILVKRGKVVDILLEGAGVRIVTRGIARENGYKGEMIKIENPTSKRIIYGRVVASGLVKVNF